MLNLTPMVRNLLFLNLGMMLLTSAFMPNLMGWLALYPVQSELFQPFQFITYMFLHGGLMHIFGNMFGLISFGPMLEQRWGAQRFLMFWMICGVGAGLLYTGIRYYEVNQMNNDRQAFRKAPSPVRLVDYYEDHASMYRGYEELARAMKSDPTNAGYIDAAVKSVDGAYQDALRVPMVGASGAIFGILLAFAYLFPNTELMLLFFPFPIKAKYFVTLYGIYELYAGVQRNPGDNVAHFAHLGGMLFGFLLLKYWEKNQSRFY
ncbi:rhomboid family intramembrane serine protease [Hymenobacter koreensis]|uniref:Rhomboid family intramembrane serine protease n=1 Tax=Hymenobacter koreensis TaxID=1084523 RepID=A0ABP8IU57_9BACT